MPRHIPAPTVISAAGTLPKIIEEYVGRVNSQTENISIARMKSPSGWIEPGQQPDFDEFTVVLVGVLHVRSVDGSVLRVRAGEGVMVSRGQWVQYSTPEAEGAEYIAVCVPAFSPDTVHRDPA